MIRERTHVARLPGVFEVSGREQVEVPAYKPRGLWWEVDGDWRRWCRDERYGPSSGHLFAVDLGESNILRLASVKDIDVFHARWSVPPLPQSQSDFRLIDWSAVARDWDGIEIAPYQWGRRLGHLGSASDWYYPWDCASGCVWRPVGVTLEYLSPYVLQDQL